MTLYLASKLGNHKIFFGSDGRTTSGSEGNSAIASDEEQKYKYLAPSLVACYSGSKFLVNEVLDIANMLANKYPDKTPDALHEVFDPDRNARLSQSLEQRIAKARGAGLDDNAMGFVRFFYFADETPTTSWLWLDSFPPYLSTISLKQTIPQIVFHDGVDTVAQEVLMDMTVRNISANDEDTLRGLFICILSETSESVDSVGGRFGLAELTRTRFKQLQEDECLGFYEIAEDLGEKLAGIPKFSDPRQLKSRVRDLAVRVYDPLSAFYLLAKKYSKKAANLTADNQVDAYTYSAALLITGVELTNLNPPMQRRKEYPLILKELAELCPELKKRSTGEISEYYQRLGETAAKMYKSVG